MGEGSLEDEQSWHVISQDDSHLITLTHLVTLSGAKGLAGWASRCVATLSMTRRLT
jgi:hypothetical protein